MADMSTQTAQGNGRGNAKIVQTAAELERLLDELGCDREFRTATGVPRPSAHHGSRGVRGRCGGSRELLGRSGP
jgi:hypothetical protein